MPGARGGARTRGGPVGPGGGVKRKSLDFSDGSATKKLLVADEYDFNDEKDPKPGVSARIRLKRYTSHEVASRFMDSADSTDDDDDDSDREYEESSDSDAEEEPNLKDGEGSQPASEDNEPPDAPEAQPARRAGRIVVRHQDTDDESEDENPDDIEENAFGPAQIIGECHPIPQTKLEDTVTLPVLQNPEKRKEREAADALWTCTDEDQTPNMTAFDSAAGLARIPDNRTPREFLRLMLPDTFFEMMVNETNAYAAHFARLRLTVEQQNRKNGKFQRLLFY